MHFDGVVPDPVFPKKLFQLFTFWFNEPVKIAQQFQKKFFGTTVFQALCHVKALNIRNPIICWQTGSGILQADFPTRRGSIRF